MLTKCADTITAFKTAFLDCKKMATDNASAACDCFKNETLTTMSTDIKACSLKEVSDAMAKAGKTCRSAYGDCRKYQEEIITVTSSCSKSTDKLKEKAKALTENADNIAKAQTAVAALTARRMSKQQHQLQRIKRAVPTTCAEMITVVELLVKVTSQNAASSKVSTYALEIVGAGTITCSDTEKNSLKTTEKSLTKAAEKVTKAKEAVLEDLQSQTGSTPSSTELAAFVAVTTVAPSRRRVQDLLSKFL